MLSYQRRSNDWQALKINIRFITEATTHQGAKPRAKKLTSPSISSEPSGKRGNVVGRVNMRIRSLWLKCSGLTGGNVEVIRKGYDSRSETGLVGWGGRDRTSECWNQNPVPYHLATPHQAGPRRGIRIKLAGPIRKPSKGPSGRGLYGWLRGRGGIVIRAPPEARGRPFRTGSESSSAW
jgi:hypothetical protein